MPAGRLGAETMAINSVAVDELAEMSRRFQPAGRSLMLGRQALMYSKNPLRSPFNSKRRYQKALDKHGIDINADELFQADGYSETMFEALGFKNIESMDVLDYELDPERGGIIHDLNKPIPKELEGQFDFIYDGGTCEHVLNVNTAMENIYKMLKPGGRIVGANPLNGWPAHGIYQFTSELVYAFWKYQCHCEVVKCLALSSPPHRYRRALHDPTVTGKNNRFRSALTPWRKTPAFRLFLFYEAVKGEGSEYGDAPQQLRYNITWDEAASKTGAKQ